MRLFIGIQLNSEWKECLEAIQQEIKSISRKGNFTVKENFHLTLRFLGDVEEQKLKWLKEQLNDQLRKCSSFDIETTGLDFFMKKRGMIPWIGIKQNKSLQDLYDTVQDCLNRVGISEEVERYTPHLTLGRKICLDGEKFLALKASVSPDLSQRVTSLTIFQSHQVDGGLAYTPLVEFPLKDK